MLLLHQVMLCTDATLSMHQRRHLYIGTRIVTLLEKDLVFLNGSDCNSRELTQLHTLCNSIKKALSHCFKNVCEDNYAQNR
jgi:hypothetical protein